MDLRDDAPPGTAKSRDTPERAAVAPVEARSDDPAACRNRGMSRRTLIHRRI